MDNKPNHFRAILFKHNGYFEAQLLEIDLAARAKTIELLIAEMEYSIDLEYEISKELGVPFSNIKKAPQYFQDMWTTSNISKLLFKNPAITKVTAGSTGREESRC